MLSILLFLSVFNLHESHISVCDIIFNQKTGSIEVIHSVMAEDLEKALKKKTGLKNTDLTVPEIYEENNKIVEKYFSEKFRLFRNGEQLKMTWIGYEIVDTQLRAYFEFEGVRNTNNITLTNRILTDEHRKQQNMVNWKFGDKLQTAILSRKSAILELIK